MISIAGKAVTVGSSLYHTSLKMWGIVARYDAGAAVLRFELSNGRHREVHIQQGGLSQGVKVAKWHVPLELDLPSPDIVRYQRLVDLMKEEGF